MQYMWHLQGQVATERDEARLGLLHGEWELHLVKAKHSYQQLKEDSALEKSDPNVLVLTFYLQQSLPTPVLITNIIFYKRQLWTYNLGIHNCRSESGHMYLWHDGMASHGAQKIASCILKYFPVQQQTISSPIVTHVEVRTETCTFSPCGSTLLPVMSLLSLWLTKSSWQ